MVNLTYYIVDVFAEKKFTGNQLAVIKNGYHLTDQCMQQIAAEFHFSETTFIVNDNLRNGGFDVRIFTPFTEVPFAGHPTLGTAYIIKKYLTQEPTLNKILLNLKIGQIPVFFKPNTAKDDILWMNQKPPTFSRILSIKIFAEILNLSEEVFDSRFPIQEVSTGLPFFIVPLLTLDAVRKAKINFDQLLKNSKNIHGGILIFAPETYKKTNNLNVRVFVDLFGIPEDPATGSANGCLAAYLSYYKYFGSDKINIKVEQGYEIKRPSLLLLKAKHQNNTIQIQVGGKVIFVASGSLQI